MSGYLRSLALNLKGLVNFAGRTSSARFWPYAGTVLVLGMILLTLAWIPRFIGLMNQMTAYALAHPDQATITSGPTSYEISIQGPTPGLDLDFKSFVPLIGGFGIAMACLLAASAVRRLHDVGKTGLWAMLPAPFFAFSMIMFPRVMDGFSAGKFPAGAFVAVFLSNGLYLAGLVVLILQLASNGSAGENRYGPAPTN